MKIYKLQVLVALFLLQSFTYAAIPAQILGDYAFTPNEKGNLDLQLLRSETSTETAVGSKASYYHGGMVYLTTLHMDGSANSDAFGIFFTDGEKKVVQAPNPQVPIGSCGWVKAPIPLSKRELAYLDAGPHMAVFSKQSYFDLMPFYLPPPLAPSIFHTYRVKPGMPNYVAEENADFSVKFSGAGWAPPTTWRSSVFMPDSLSLTPSLDKSVKIKKGVDLVVKWQAATTAAEVEIQINGLKSDRYILCREKGNTGQITVPQKLVDQIPTGGRWQIYVDGLNWNHRMLNGRKISVIASQTYSAKLEIE